MMNVVITSLLQLDEGGNRSRRTTDVNGQLTFRPPLGQALEYIAVFSQSVCDHIASGTT